MTLRSFVSSRLSWSTVLLGAISCVACGGHGSSKFLSDGTPCKADYQCASASCVGGACAPPSTNQIEIGDACPDEGFCGFSGCGGPSCVWDAFCDPQSNTCVPSSGACGIEGDACVTAGDCCEQAACDPTTKTCAAPCASAGVDCTTATQCCSGVCNGTCG